MTWTMQKQAQKQHLEIADSSRDLLKNSINITMKNRIFESTLWSDFLKHSSNFGGSGVDFGRHFGGAFGVENSQNEASEAGFRMGFASTRMRSKNCKNPEIGLKPWDY